MLDSLLDPFSQLTDQKEFLTSSVPEVSGTDLKIFQLSFTLNNKIRMISRKRYSFWQALGDIGGFHDGLYLLINITMAPLSASMFFNKFVHGKVYSTQPISQKRAYHMRKVAAQSLLHGE